MKLATLAAAAALALAGAINSTTTAEDFDFTYVLKTGDVLTGCMAGTIQPDGNTVIVTSVTMAALNGVFGTALPFVDSVIEADGGPVGDPIVSFDGTVMDIVAADSPATLDGFLFDGAGAVFVVPAFVSGSTYGRANDLYNSDNWSLRLRNVPDVGATFGLFALACGSLLAARRRG